MDCPINRTIVSTPCAFSCRGVPLPILEGRKELIYCPGRLPLPPSGGVPILLPLLPSGGVPILLPPVPSGRGAHAPAGLTAHAAAHTAAAVDEALERDVGALTAHGDGVGAALCERRGAHDDAGIGLRGRKLREYTRTPTAGWPSFSTAIRELHAVVTFAWMSLAAAAGAWRWCM